MRVIWNLADSYGINFFHFLYVYLFSIIPIYLGLFLMLVGLDIRISFKNLIVGLRGKFFQPKGVKNIKIFFIGLTMHLFGWLMPYLYLALYSEKVNILLKLAFILLLCGFLLFKFRNHFFTKFQTILDPDIKIRKELVIGDRLADQLWNIYDSAFSRLNALSPCRQSFHQSDFYKVMKVNDVLKFVAYDGDTPVGLAMLTSSLRHSTWISEDFFRTTYSEFYNEGRLFYFLGIALRPEYRKRRVAIAMLFEMSKHVPDDCLIGFDHSGRHNKLIRKFPYIFKPHYRVKRHYLDSMKYYAVIIKR